MHLPVGRRVVFPDGLRTRMGAGRPGLRWTMLRKRRSGQGAPLLPAMPAPSLPGKDACHDKGEGDGKGYREMLKGYCWLFLYQYNVLVSQENTRSQDRKAQKR